MNPLQEEIRRRIMQATSIALEACDAVKEELGRIDVDHIEGESLQVVMANGLESTAANLMQCAHTLKVANLRLAVDNGSASFDEAIKEILGSDDDD
jgi:hypothetical protein